MLYDHRMTTVEPNGCAVCGVLERSHGSVYHGLGTGYDKYITPTDRQRKQRMLDNRANTKQPVSTSTELGELMNSHENVILREARLYYDRIQSVGKGYPRVEQVVRDALYYGVFVTNDFERILPTDPRVGQALKVLGRLARLDERTETS